MTILQKMGAGLLAGATLLAGAQAQAQGPEQSQYYVGGNWGVGSNYALSCYPGLQCDRGTSHGGKIYAGYRLGNTKLFGDMPNVNSLELAVFETGGALGYLPRWDTALMEGRYKMTGLALTHASALALTDAWRLNSRLGLAYTRGRVEYENPLVRNDFGTYSGADHRYRIGATAGAGLSYALNRNWSLHGDYDYVPVKYSNETGNSHVNMWSLGASYHF